MSDERTTMTAPTCLGCFFDNPERHAMACPERLQPKSKPYRLGWALGGVAVSLIEAGTRWLRGRR